MPLCPRPRVKVLAGLCLVLLVLLCYLTFIENPHRLLEKHIFATNHGKKLLNGATSLVSHKHQHLPLLYSQAPKSGSCSCSAGATVFEDVIPKTDLENLSHLRAQEMRSLKSRVATLLSTPLHAPPNSPLQFPIQGYVVQPLTPTVIPDLALEAEHQSSYEVSLRVSKGVLTTDTKAEVKVTGTGTVEMVLMSSSLQSLNQQLANIHYTSATYHVNDGDLVSFQFEKHVVMFPVVIKEKEMPFMRDLGKDINTHVTVATMIRGEYTPVKTLVTSIRQNYPNVSIIIVDENKEREVIAGDNIEQYYMPSGKGWFAGRAVAVTQVNTKYFLWVDDNFLFTKSTKLEKFVEIMEANPELDVLGGVIRGKKSYFTLLYEEGNEVEGGCLHMKFNSKFNSLPNYPQCSLVSGVANFFLGRADTVVGVGFDSKLHHTANPEIFIDGLGSLMVASCDDPSSLSIEPQSDSQLENTFELPNAKDPDYRHSIYYYKNHLKCVEYV